MYKSGGDQERENEIVEERERGRGREKEGERKRERGRGRAEEKKRKRERGRGREGRREREKRGRMQRNNVLQTTCTCRHTYLRSSYSCLSRSSF